MRTPYTVGYHKYEWSLGDELVALHTLHLAITGTPQWGFSDVDFFRHMWE